MAFVTDQQTLDNLGIFGKEGIFLFYRKEMYMLKPDMDA